jgi:hypothetical protein
MTLAQKADYFEQRVHARHDRWGQVSNSELKEPGNLATNQLRSSDNDGLWTAMYAASQVFRYAVTKSPEALANARKTIGAVLFLEEVTGRPGFPARSWITKDEPRPRDGQWHWTPDNQIQWKGDTSSDEIVGHFFIYGIAYDLLDDAAAQGAHRGDHAPHHGSHSVERLLSDRCHGQANHVGTLVTGILRLEDRYSR